MSDTPDKEETEMATMELDLTKDEIYQLAMMAHERDITLNKMIELILQEMIDKLDREEALAEMAREAKELGLDD